jgi:hypothetical protein
LPAPEPIDQRTALLAATPACLGPDEVFNVVSILLANNVYLVLRELPAPHHSVAGGSAAPTNVT